jgi:hypothetical protein
MDEMVLEDRELRLVETFVVPDKRERYSGFLRSPKRRSKFLRELYHFADFDPASMFEPGPGALLGELQRRGAAHDGYLISVDPDLDGRTMELPDALMALSEGTLVCCVPGKLAYYEGEPPKNRFILQRGGGLTGR